jgi:hypothetical protein
LHSPWGAARRRVRHAWARALPIEEMNSGVL